MEYLRPRPSSAPSWRRSWLMVRSSRSPSMVGRWPNFVPPPGNQSRLSVAPPVVPVSGWPTTSTNLCNCLSTAHLSCLDPAEAPARQDCSPLAVQPLSRDHPCRCLSHPESHPVQSSRCPPPLLLPCKPLPCRTPGSVPGSGPFRSNESSPFTRSPFP